jgi:hypothetical protein
MFQFSLQLSVFLLLELYTIFRSLLTWGIRKRIIKFAPSFIGKAWLLTSKHLFALVCLVRLENRLHPVSLVIFTFLVHLDLLKL